MKFSHIPTDLKIGIKDTFTSALRIVSFLGLALLIFLLFVLVPVWTTPGNDILFQLSIFTWDVYLLMIVLSLLNSLLILMQYHVRKKARANLTGKHAVTGLGIITASIASTLACASCYSSVLALFGLGGTIFIVKHRWWFAAFAFGLSAVALIYTARRIAHGCKECQIKSIE